MQIPKGRQIIQSMSQVQILCYMLKTVGKFLL